MNVFIAIKATTKATMFPMTKAVIFSDEDKIISYPFMAFAVPLPHVFTKTEYTVTASMVGTARKKENSAAAFLESPCVIPQIIEAALLLVPGIIARHCQNPIITAVLMLICFSSVIFGLLNQESANNKITPPKTNTAEIAI